MPDESVALHGEESIIQTFLRPLSAGWPGAFELQDDCAVIAPAPGQDIVIKTDPIRAGVHFFADDQPEDIAWKALAVNVSDLAAKAARPLAYTLALSFPESPQSAWMGQFATGLEQAQRAFGCVLIGGDTDRAEGPLSIAVTVFGEVPSGRMMRRATPKPGDHIFVSGTLGDAALGLQVRNGTMSDELSEGARDSVLRRYLHPEPRLGLRSALRGYASAAMDISDGLAKDLDRMCRAAGLGAIVRLGDLPLSDALLSACRGDRLAARPFIFAGDDYELLCAVPPDLCDKFAKLAAAGHVEVTDIGQFNQYASPQLLDELGASIEWGSSGYDHF